MFLPLLFSLLGSFFQLHTQMLALCVLFDGLKQLQFGLLILLKLPLHVQYVQHDHKIAQEIPPHTSILVDYFMPHVRSNVREFVEAITKIGEKRDLSVQIDCCSCTAIAIDENTAHTSVACTCFRFAEFIAECEKQSCQVQSMNVEHQSE